MWGSTLSKKGELQTISRQVAKAQIIEMATHSFDPLGLAPLRLCERLFVFREHLFIWANRPCFKAFSDERALPFGVLGAVHLCTLQRSRKAGRKAGVRSGDLRRLIKFSFMSRATMDAEPE